MIQSTNRIHPWIVILLTLLSGSSVVAASNMSPDAAKADYIKALGRLQEKFDHCYGEGLLTEFNTLKKNNPHATPLERTYFQFSYAGGRGKTVASPLKSIDHDIATPIFAAPTKSKPECDPNRQGINAFNEKYSFSLRKDAAGYKIVSLTDGSKPGKKSIANQLAPFAQAPVTAYHRPIAAFFDIVGFHLDRVTSIGEGAGARLKLEFAVPLRPIVRPQAFQITSGWFVVSTAEDWLVHEYGVVTHWANSTQGTAVGHVQYSPGLDGQWVPTRVSNRVYRGIHTADPATIDPTLIPIVGEDFEFADFRFGDDPKADFTLGAYGLPEFGRTVGKAEAARAFPWWPAGAAVGFGVLAVVLRRLAGRGKPAPQAG